MEKKKGRSNKGRPPLSSEERPSDILAHKELAHEDQDLIYPFDPIQGETTKGLGSEKQDLWKSDRKNTHKKKNNDQGYKNKKRKAG
jgi:hypothetical protein